MVIKTNKCLFVLRSLRKEVPNFSYGLSAYCAKDLDLTFIQNFQDRCFKRKDTSKRMDIGGPSRHAQSFLIGYLVTSEEKINKVSS